MVSTNKIRICPSCDTDLSLVPEQLMTPEGDECCPYCRKCLKTPAHKNFGSPDYLHHQRNSLLKDGGADKLKPGDKKYETRSVRLEWELTEWARSCSDEDRVAAFEDALRLLKEVMHSNSTSETIGAMTTMGRSIGKLSESIDQYYKAGGFHHDRKARLVPPEFGDDTGNQASATASRDKF